MTALLFQLALAGVLLVVLVVAVVRLWQVTRVTPLTGFEARRWEPEVSELTEAEFDEALEELTVEVVPMLRVPRPRPDRDVWAGDPETDKWWNGGAA